MNNRDLYQREAFTMVNVARMFRTVDGELVSSTLRWRLRRSGSALELIVGRPGPDRETVELASATSIPVAERLIDAIRVAIDNGDPAGVIDVAPLLELAEGEGEQ